ncbi:hypothetical protein BT93_G2382 [Corymbia citriodora subsp. variegata]|nr:hypothetical protein BT93_G2382 [Corymbia citriodora subsp. variegata]
MSRIRLLLYLLDREPKISLVIVTGVNVFLVKEYLCVGFLMVIYAILIFLFLGYVERFSTQSQPCTFYPPNMCRPALAIAVSFLLGALTSVLSGILGIKIAIRANARTALMDRDGSFNAAFRSSAAMGFLLAAIGLLGLYSAIKLFECYYGNEWEVLSEVITGYALGASSIAFFGRAGGGIYAKAVDVYVDLVNRNWPHYLEDRNLSVIPYNVGDIVGDIAGMGTDLFCSSAESSCAALVVASISSFGIDHTFTAMCYPLLISSMGILVCLITTLVGEIKPLKKQQLIISAILMTVGIATVSSIALPLSFKIDNFGSEKVVKNRQLVLCVVVGLWAGPIIGFFPEFHTNDCISYIRELVTKAGVPLASVCALLTSVVIPIYADFSISVSFSFAATYGIAVAALGMLSTIATRLAIDAHAPISHYVTRITNMARYKAFGPAGNPPADTGKGFAIESTALVSIALFGAFVSRAAISRVDFQTPMVLIGPIVGYMLPYFFSAMTMKSVGRSGLKMTHEVHDARSHNAPECARYITISTVELLRGLILPGALVMFAPVFLGTLFGAETVTGVLAGSFSSVLWIANSASNANGALNRANEHIAVCSCSNCSKAGALEYAKKHCRGELLRTAESGETIGDPRKDTSGPPLNILIQLMAAESLVFARFFAAHRGLLSKIF